MRHVLTLAVVLLAGCALFNRIDPPLNETPSKDYPCGRTGVVCMRETDAGAFVATGACCDEGEVCGGGFPNVACPVGRCCTDTSDLYDTSVGAKRPHPQRPMPADAGAP